MSLQIIRIADFYGEIKLDDGTKLLISLTNSETAIFTLNFFHFPSTKIWSVGTDKIVNKLEEDIPTMIITNIINFLENSKCEKLDQVNDILTREITN